MGDNTGHSATTTTTATTAADDDDGTKPALLDTRHDPFYRYLFGQIAPPMFLVTLAANSLIIMVLSRPAMRTPTNLVLLAMALADLLTLIFPVPWYFYLYSLGYYQKFLHPMPICYLFRIMTEWLPTIWHTASIWCTLLLAGQRYIYICHPTTAKVWCTNQRVLRAIVAIFIVAFLMNLSKLFDTRFEDTWWTTEETGNSNGTGAVVVVVPACRIVVAEWAMAIDNLYFGTYYVFRLVFVHLLPCFLLVIFNVFLYNALKRAEITRNKLLKNRHELHKNGSGTSRTSTTTMDHHHHGGRTGNLHPAGDPPMPAARKSNRGRDANSTTFMLIVVVTVFLIVEIPLAVGIALHFAENMFNINIVSDDFLFMIITFSNFFIIISYPLNFAIYCGMSRAFRETFQQMFLFPCWTNCCSGGGGFVRRESPASSSPHTQITSGVGKDAAPKSPPPPPPQQPPPDVAKSIGIVIDYNGTTTTIGTAKRTMANNDDDCQIPSNTSWSTSSSSTTPPPPMQQPERRFSRETMV